MILSPKELDELERELEALSEICAEDANEAAMYGDGPVGSQERALAYRRAQRRYDAHRIALVDRMEMEQDDRHGYLSGLDSVAEEDFIPF